MPANLPEIGTALDGNAIAIPVRAEPSERARDVNQLAAGAGIAVVGKVAGRSARLLVDVVLTRVLGPAGYGLYTLGWTVSRVVTVITPLGLESAVIRYGSRHRDGNPELLRGVLLESLYGALLSGILAGAVAYLAADRVAAGIFHKPALASVIRCFAFAIPMITVLRVAAAATRVAQRVKYAVTSEDMCQPVTNLLLVLAFSALGYGLAGALAASVFSFGIALGLAVLYVYRLFPVVASTSVKSELPGTELFVFSLPACLSGLLTALLLWVDRLQVGYFRSAAETGIYIAASQLSIAFSIVVGGMSAMFSPMTADLSHRHEIRRIEELFRVSTKWALYCCLPPFLVICFAPRQVMSVLFGAPFEVGWLALVILAAGQLVNAGTGPVTSLIVMTGYQNRLFALSGVVLLLGFSLNLLLIPRWGIAGAAIGTACAISGLFLGGVFMARHALGIWPYDRRYGKGVLATVVAAGALFVLRIWGIGSPLLILGAAAAVAVAAFAGTLLLLGLDPEDRAFIELVWARLR